jgi:hypothetical protein
MTEDSSRYADAYHGLCTELGHLLITANALEEILVDFVWLLSKQDRKAAIEVVRGKTMGPLIAYFLREYRKLDAPELIARLDAIEPALATALETRNEYIHAGWKFSVEGWATRARRPRSGHVRDEIAKLTLETILDAAQRIEAASDVLQELWEDTVEKYGIPQPSETIEYVDLTPRD